MRIERLLFVTVALLLTYNMAQAQLGNRINNAVRNAAENAAVRQAERRTENAVNKAIDDAFDNSNSNSNNNNAGNAQQGNSVQPTGGNAANNSQPAVANQDPNIPPRLESYSQYDFVPGDQILFYEDFSQDAIGDFPALWTTNGSGEVKTLNNYPGKWHQITSKNGVITYLNKLELPPNFIIEFDYISYGDEVGTGGFKLYHDAAGRERELDVERFPGQMGFRFYFQNNPNDAWYAWSIDTYDNRRSSNDRYGQTLTSTNNSIKSGQLNHIIVWVQNRRVRVYHDGAKTMDLPTALFPDMTFTRLMFMTARDDNRPFFSNIKITTAAPDVRSKLLTEGKIISYGINFDSGKDVIKPESYGAVKALPMC